MKKIFTIIASSVFFLASVVPSFAAPSVAVMPFERADGLDPMWGDQIETAFLNGIVEFGKGSFSVLDRGTLENAVTANGKQLRGGFDETAAVLVGRVAGADKVILGKVQFIGDKTVTVSAILADVESGKIETAAQVDTALYVNSMRYWVGTLAKQISGVRAPEKAVRPTAPVSASVPEIPKPGPDVAIDWGRYDNNRRAIFYDAVQSNYAAAFYELDRFSKALETDSRNPYFRGGDADIEYLGALRGWEKEARVTLSRSRIDYDIGRAIDFIRKAKDRYVAVMRNGGYPDAPFAEAVRWNGVLDRIGRFHDPEPVFGDAGVQAAYSSAFRLNLCDDLTESRKCVLCVKVLKYDNRSGTTEVRVTEVGTGTKDTVTAKNDGSAVRIDYLGPKTVSVSCDGETFVRTLMPRSVVTLNLPTLFKRMGDDLKYAFPAKKK